MQLAQELLDRHWGGELPVNVRSLANSIAIQVITDNDCPAMASLTLSDDEVTARIKGTVPEQQRRFVIAHQIGHRILRHLSRTNPVLKESPGNFRAGTSAPDEREANEFACALLMPENTLKYAINYKGYCVIGDLAKLFGVSEVAMQKRLVELKIIQA